MTSNASRAYEAVQPIDDLSAASRILFLTNFDLLRQGLAESLGQTEGYLVDGITLGQDVRAKLESFEPDFLIVDLTLPDERTIDCIEQVAETFPDVAIVLFGVENLQDEVLRCVRAGVSGYIAHDSTADDLVKSLHQIEQGGVACSPRLAYTAFGRLSELAQELQREQKVEALELTSREMEVIRHIAEGASNQAIANSLSLSVFTVKNHVHNILAKLDVKNRHEAVAYARERGWIYGRSRRASTSGL
jgi:DNA-binding NarL/FixJ family response regulator